MLLIFGTYDMPLKGMSNKWVLSRWWSWGEWIRKHESRNEVIRNGRVLSLIEGKIKEINQLRWVGHVYKTQVYLKWGRIIGI